MEKLNKAADKYYQELESIGIRYYLLSSWFWVLITSTIFFCIDSFHLISHLLSNAIDFDWEVAIASLACGMLILYSQYRIRKNKEKLILKRGSQKYQIEFESFNSYKRFLLKLLFGRRESKYLEFVEEIDKALQIHLKLVTSNVKGAPEFLKLIYDPDSKQRIYGLLLALCSMILALSIKLGSDLETLMLSLSSFTLGQIGVYIAVITMILGGLLLLLLMLKIGIEVFVEYLSNQIERREFIGRVFKIKYLQIDLLRFHQFIILRPQTLHVDLGV